MRRGRQVDKIDRRNEQDQHAHYHEHPEPNRVGGRHRFAFSRGTGVNFGHRKQGKTLLVAHFRLAVDPDKFRKPGVYLVYIGAGPQQGVRIGMGGQTVGFQYGTQVFAREFGFHIRHVLKRRQQVELQVCVFRKRPHYAAYYVWACTRQQEFFANGVCFFKNPLRRFVGQDQGHGLVQGRAGIAE